MCGRYGRRADKQRIAEWFRTHDTDVFNEEYYETNAVHFTPSYNICSRECCNRWCGSTAIPATACSHS